MRVDTSKICTTSSIGMSRSMNPLPQFSTLAVLTQHRNCNDPSGGTRDRLPLRMNCFNLEIIPGAGIDRAQWSSFRTSHADDGMHMPCAIPGAVPGKLPEFSEMRASRLSFQCHPIWSRINSGESPENLFLSLAGSMVCDLPISDVSRVF